MEILEPHVTRFLMTEGQQQGASVVMSECLARGGFRENNKIMI